MDITKILEELRQEHAQLEEAILSLERLAAGGKRRGRPPAWLAAAQQREPKAPGRPAAKSKPAPAAKKQKKASSEQSEA